MRECRKFDILFNKYGGGIATQYDELLNLSTELGYQLMVSGAEIYRTEDSMSRLLRAYGVETGEVFAIPNCIIVSIVGEGEKALTRIRRIPPHSTDIDQLERWNGLCRALCRETPDYDGAMERMAELSRTRRGYPHWKELVGYFVGAFGFCLFFGGTAADALFSGLCGVVIGGCLLVLSRLGSNTFFKTIAASAVSAFLAIVMARLGPHLNADLITIGALMALMPGVCFTSALRDIMAGDMVSGISKAAEGILIAVAIAIGTGAALGMARTLWGG